MPTVKLAFRGKMYLNGGSYGAPTWNEIKSIKEPTVGADMDKVDATTRLGGGIKQYEPVLLDLMFGGKVQSDETDTTGFVVLETAFLTRAPVDLMILDGDKGTNGSRGYRFDAKNFKFGEDQGVEKILYREFELAPCVSTNATQKVVVAASAPVFTTLAS